MNKPQSNFCDLVEMYVLGGLSDGEYEEFVKHLSACDECLEKVDELRDIVDLLPTAVRHVDAPAGMKQRVLGNILGESYEKPLDSAIHETDTVKSIATSVTTLQKKDSSKKGSFNEVRNTAVWKRIAISGLSAAVVLLGMYSFMLNQQIKGLELEVARATTPADQPFTINDVVKLSPQAEDIVASGLATIIVDSRGTHLVVQAEQLPELEGTEAFQVWLLKDGQPHNAGTFLTQQGNGALMFTFNPQEYDTIAITLEPDAEGDLPEGQIVLAAPLKQG
jgi:hypothetical protein